MTRIVLLLAVVAGCGPKTPRAAPVDDDLPSARAPSARAIPDLHQRGELTRLEPGADLAAQAERARRLGRYLWQAEQARSVAAETFAPHAAEDPTWAGVHLAVPAFREDMADCCFDVHFPALVNGEPATWLHGLVGWYPRATVLQPNFRYVDGRGREVKIDSMSHQLRLVPPLPKAMTPELARRVRALRHFADLVAAHPEAGSSPYTLALVALPDLALGDGYLLYAIPTPEDPDRVVVSGWHHAAVPAGGDRPTSVSLLGGPRRIATRDEATTASGAVGLVVDGDGAAPNEAHVVASLVSGIPLWVRTDAGVWHVDGDELALYRTPGGR